jgi:hypothetical protein
LSREDFSDLAAASRRPLEIAASAAFSQTLVDDEVSEIVSGEAVTGNYFQKFGATPAQGRLIQWADDGAPSRVAVISHRLWRSKFGAHADVVCGLDHALAMTAVGALAWFVVGRARVLLPAGFLAMLIAGLLSGLAGLVLPHVETTVAATVAAIGALLLAGRRLPLQLVRR